MNKIYQKTIPGVKNAGFTLIELLVVVLIIGILTAIALPQYNIAVAKARFLQAMVLGRSLYDAEERCKMATGAYCSISDLDIRLPGGAVVKDDDSGGYASSTYSTKNFSCSVNLAVEGIGCYYYVDGFSFDNAYFGISRSSGAYCMAYNDTISHQVCKSVTGAGSGTDRTYGSGEGSFVGTTYYFQ